MCIRDRSKNYANGSQTANAMALFLELPEEEYREPVLQNLEEDIRLKGGHFTGGDVGHPYILRALAKYGRNDIIAENFMKTDFPSSVSYTHLDVYKRQDLKGFTCS